MWGRESFDYLVNNAGVGLYAAFAETSEALFDELMNIHFKGPFFLTQQLLPLLADGGRILNVSTGLAFRPAGKAPPDADEVGGQRLMRLSASYLCRAFP